MKKFLMLCLSIASILSMQLTHATDTANIKIKITGSSNRNIYFLCMPDLGCLSILAAKKGKIFPVTHEVEMNTLFITDTTTMRVHNQGFPKSCDVNVKPNQTITISGTLITQGDKVKINQLLCSLS